MTLLHHIPNKATWFLKRSKDDIFSSPDPKGHVSYSHHLASVVRRPSVVRPSYVVNFFKNLLL